MRKITIAIVLLVWAAMAIALIVVRSTSLSAATTMSRTAFAYEVMQICGDTRFLWVIEPGESGSGTDMSPYGQPITHTVPLTTSVQGNGHLAYFDGAPEIHEVSDQDHYTFGNGVEDYPFTFMSLFTIGDISESVGVLTKFSSDRTPGATQDKEYEQFIYGTPAGYWAQHGVELSERFVMTLHSGLATNDMLLTISAEKVPLNTPLTWAVSYDGSGDAAGLTQYKNGKVAVATNIESGTYIAMANGQQPLRIGSNIDGLGRYPGEPWIGDRGFDLVCGRELSPHDVYLIDLLVEMYFDL